MNGTTSLASRERERERTLFSSFFFLLENVPDPLRLAILDAQAEVGHRNASRGAIDDREGARPFRGDAHEEEEVLVPQFGKGIHFGPKGTHLGCALQLKLVKDHIPVPPSPNGVRAIRLSLVQFQRISSGLIPVDGAIASPRYDLPDLNVAPRNDPLAVNLPHEGGRGGSVRGGRRGSRKQSRQRVLRRRP